MTPNRLCLSTVIAAVLGLNGPATQAQRASAPTVRPAAPASAAQAAFRLCDSRTFVASSMARTYLYEGRDRQKVIALVNNDNWARPLAENLMRRVDASEIKHPAQFAAEILFQCAITEAIQVGASRTEVQVCLARTDIAAELHAARLQGTSRVQAVARTRGRLKPPELYPPAMVDTVADIVYSAKTMPSLRALSSEVLWGCLAARPRTPAPAASR
jgi:hypothetical protein